MIYTKRNYALLIEERYLDPGDYVVFEFPESVIIYHISHRRFDNIAGQRSAIFNRLGILAVDYCTLSYGYPTNGNLEFREEDYRAVSMLFRSLFQEMEEAVVDPFDIYKDDIDVRKQPKHKVDDYISELIHCVIDTIPEDVPIDTSELMRKFLVTLQSFNNDKETEEKEKQELHRISEEQESSEEPVMENLNV